MNPRSENDTDEIQMSEINSRNTREQEEEDHISSPITSPLPGEHEGGTTATTTSSSSYTAEDSMKNGGVEETTHAAAAEELLATARESPAREDEGEGDATSTDVRGSEALAIGTDLEADESSSVRASTHEESINFGDGGTSLAVPVPDMGVGPSSEPPEIQTTTSSPPPPSTFEIGGPSTTPTHTHDDEDKRRQQQQLEMYRAAIEADYSFQSSSEPPLTKSRNNILHIHVASPFRKRSAKIDFIRRCVDRDVAMLRQCNDNGETPLHVAARFGQVGAVKCFLSYDPDLFSLENHERDTALHIAVRNKHVLVVRQLLSISDMEDKPNAAGETPISLAVETGSEEMLNFFLKHARVLKLQPVNQFTGSILHVAVLKRCQGIVKIILEKFPELMEVKDQYGQTPYHYAAAIDDGILGVLLGFKKDDATAVYIQDKEGRTAAHIAAQHNNLEGLKSLVEKFPDCCETGDLKRRNVVHYAAFLGCEETLEYFLTDGRFIDLLQKRDNDGNMPFHLLANSLTELPMASVIYIRQKIIPKLDSMQLMVFNNNHLTPGDIAHSYKLFELEPAYQDLVRDFTSIAPRGGRNKPWIHPLEQHKNVEGARNQLASNLQKAAKNHAIVATLIATMSFAAGLAVPGGFNQNVGKDGGTALLTKKPAFQVFLISDTIALTSSVIAILIYFLIALGKGKGSSKMLFAWAFIATSVSMVTLMVAFMAGTYSVVWQSTLLAILVISIASAFIFFYSIFVIASLAFLRARSSLRDRKLRKKVLSHGQG